MLLKIDGRNEGAVPSEAVVTIDTLEGREEVIVHSSQIKGNSVEVGVIGKTDDKRVLVELPRETLKGKWRVWVKEGDLQPA
jgi:hypothetical protein